MWGVRRNLTLPHKFVCLTDDVYLSVGGLAHIIPLKHNWPGWWSKIEAFRLPGPLLYLDLDTVVVGSLDGLATALTAERPGLVMLRGFYRADPCSGLMAWSDSSMSLYLDFVNVWARNAEWARLRIPGCYSLSSKGKRFKGDQDWIREWTRSEGWPVTIAQNLVNGIYSYKVHVREGRWLPSEARLVCFHGQPRPHRVSPTPDWLKEHFWASELEKDGTTSSESR